MTDNLWEVRQGDALTTLEMLPDESVQTCITSPPYFGLRDYGVDGQMGAESTPDAYVDRMAKVFTEVRRVLRNDGTLWLNVGDSYTSGGRLGHGVRVGAKQRTNRGATETTAPIRPPQPEGLKPKDLIGIPWMLAFALRANGWYLRCDIIWHKPNGMTESVKDRPTKVHEYLFLLSKSPRYHYDYEAIRESSVKGAAGSRFDIGKTAVHGLNRASTKKRKEREGRNRRSVWSVATQPYREAHFATFPPKLVEPCVLASCPLNGLVLDPFSGAGTTGLVAVRLGRRYLGIELNSAYCELARQRIRSDNLK